jgi:hypothetical protein
VQKWLQFTDIPYAFSLETPLRTLKALFPDNLTSAAKSVELVFLGQPNNRMKIKLNHDSQQHIIEMVWIITVYSHVYVCVMHQQTAYLV